MRTSRILTAVEAHAEGEPGRVITGGAPILHGASVFEKMQDMARNHDDLRLLMLREPRGYPALCCNMLVPPCDPKADAGFIIMEQTEYPPMSGSNTICVVTVLLETGILPMTEPVTNLTLEAPAGLIRVRADCKNGKVVQVTFQNVPAFALHLDASLDVPGLGRIAVDIAWGGMFYVLADADALGVSLAAENGAQIVQVSERILSAAQEQLPVAHPENPAITGPTITQLYGAPVLPGTHQRNAVTVSSGGYDPDKPHAVPGTLDRSPCGTGTCARMAALFARGELKPGQDFVNAGPLGTLFTGSITDVTEVAGHPAIIPSLSGQGWITGLSQWTLDPTDPFRQGYRIGDIWA
ncbi:proline racemase family protein [Roseovarius aestuariivivens]|uniref:proline racemase family protein n=1 Tax=Roseovarius aestuariivivens TaxID=1888910 RepID=UPI001081EF83|nr:proline racemase family protein [Roseovarius aestuariivivens]